MNRHVIHPQPEPFLRSLAPDPQNRLTRAIKALPKGETKGLEGRLAGYFRLRIGGYRLIYADSVKADVRTFDCLFMERRSVGYELFERILIEQALE